MDSTRALPVGFCRPESSIRTRKILNHTLTLILSIHSPPVNFPRNAGTPFALSSYNVAYKIGFPGWPEPNLDWVFGFGGSVLRRRGLAPAPFFVLGDFCPGWLVRSSRGWSNSVTQAALPVCPPSLKFDCRPSRSSACFGCCFGC